MRHCIHCGRRLASPDSPYCIRCADYDDASPPYRSDLELDRRADQLLELSRGELWWDE